MSAASQALACLRAGHPGEALLHLDNAVAAGDESLAAALALLKGGWPDFAEMILDEQVRNASGLQQEGSGGQQSGLPHHDTTEAGKAAGDRRAVGNVGRAA